MPHTEFVLAYSKWVGGCFVAAFTLLFGILFHFELEHRRSKQSRAAVVAVFVIMSLAVTALIVRYIHTD